MRNTDFHINLKEFKNWLPPIPVVPREEDGRCERHSGVSHQMSHTASLLCGKA
jgi:hypothetical protein